MLRTNEVDELRERMDNLIESRKYNKSIPEAVRELEKERRLVEDLRGWLREYMLTNNGKYVKLMCNNLNIKK